MATPHADSRFPITRWTAVVQVCQANDDAARRTALTGICQDYWYPLYAFARRMGHSPPDAEDLTQGFFGYLLEHNVLATVSRGQGKLRTFLLAVFQRYIGDMEDRQRAQKRGGGQVFVPLDLLNAEELYRHEPADPATPESLFERSWALHLLRGSLDLLRKAEAAKGGARSFGILACFLDPETGTAMTAESAAQDLGMSPEAVRQAVSRLRRKFRDTLRRQIASTLHDPNESQVDEELRALQAALRG
jgi:RNA polymerase sigma-70 factor (ECF subfamily)